MYISLKGVCECWVKNRGWWCYSGQNESQYETPSGQNETHLGNLYEKWAKCSRIGQTKFNHFSVLLIPQALATRVELSVCVLAAMCKQVHLLPLLTLSVAPPSSPPPWSICRMPCVGLCFQGSMNKTKALLVCTDNQVTPMVQNDKDSFDSLLCVKNGFFLSDLAVLADRTD